jgi:hypothetical protein
MLVLVKCHCCDVPFHFPQEVLARMKVPSTFCERCFNSFDALTLRKWFVVDILHRQVQELSRTIEQVLGGLVNQTPTALG